MKKACFSVWGEMATSDAPAASIAEAMKDIASIWPTQNGHQRPRIKQSTRRPLAKRLAEETSLPLWSGSSNEGALAPTLKLLSTLAASPRALISATARA